MKAGLAAVFVILWYAGPVLAGDIYRWLDEHGKVHYGDRPGISSARKVLVDSRDKIPANPAGGERKQKQQRLLKAYEIERQRKQEKRQKVRKEKHKLANDCATARKKLREIRDARYLYQKGKDGKRAIYTAAQRQAATRELRDAIARHCD